MPLPGAPGSPGSSGDDSISINSTAPSERRKEYPLEGVLAEREMNGTTEYLVKWEGYPDERCTWEVGPNFQNDKTLSDWEHRKMRIKHGLEPPYDVDALEKRVELWIEENSGRKVRRRAKRLRLGFSMVPDEKNDTVQGGDGSSSRGEEDNYVPLDTPPRNRRRLTRQTGHNLQDFIDDSSGEEDLPPTKRRLGRWTAEETKTLIEGLKQVEGPHWNQLLGLFGSKGTINTALKGRTRLQLKDKACSLKLTYLEKGQELPSYLHKVIGELKPRHSTGNQYRHSPKQIDLGQNFSNGEETSSTEDSLMDSIKTKHFNKTPDKFQKSSRIRTKAKPTEDEREAKSNNSVKGQPSSIGPRKAVSTGETINNKIARPHDSQMGVIGRGPARMINTSFKKVATAGASILRNWNAKPKPRKKNPAPQPGLGLDSSQRNNTFNKLSIKRKFEKAGRNEPAPNPEHLTFVNLKDGQVTGEPTGISPKTYAPSKTPWEMIQENLAQESRDRSNLENASKVAEPAPSDGHTDSDLHGTNDLGKAQESFNTPFDKIETLHPKATLLNAVSIAIPDHAPTKSRDRFQTDTTMPFLADTQPGVTYAATLPILSPSESPTFQTWSPLNQKYQSFGRFGGQNIRDFSDVFGTIIVGIDQQTIGTVRFRGLPKSAKAILLSIKIPPDQVHVWFQQICTADDYSEYFHGDGSGYYGAGYVVPFSNTKAPVEAMAETLRTHDSGGLFFTSTFTMLIYPSGTDAWRFLGELSTNPQGDCPPPTLRFVMWPSKSQSLIHAARQSATSSIISVMDGESGVNSHFRQVFNIEYSRLIPQNTRNSDEDPHKFFLMYLNTHNDEHEVMVKFLEANNAKIYTAYTPGEWEHFAHFVDVGVILIHGSFIRYHQIPSLIRVLRKPINIFSISLNSTPPEPYLTRIFPHGAALLLTDSLILNEPGGALRILKWFHAYVLITKAPRTWKLVIRPRIRDWILSIIEDRDLEHGKIFVEIWALIYKLLPLDLMEEEDNYETPKEEAPVACSWEITGFDRNVGVGVHRSDAKLIAKNDSKLVEWFAGWAITQIERHRKFQVISVPLEEHEKERREWGDRWKHIEILKPEEFYIAHRISKWEMRDEQKTEARQAAKERKVSKASEKGLK